MPVYNVLYINHFFAMLLLHFLDCIFLLHRFGVLFSSRSLFLDPLAEVLLRGYYGRARQIGHQI
jgi:hypothetical protein